MNKLRFSVRMFCVCLLLLLHLNLASAQEVKLNGVPFQQVLDQLFGTTTTPGLLAGKQRFELRAENVTLSTDQAQNFFVPTTANPTDLAALVTTAEQIRGAEVKIEGLLNGSPFELKLEGKEVKVEGLSLTQAQLDSLVQQLKGIQGLREVKIESLVDGKMEVVKIENRAGRVKVEDRQGHNKDARHDANDDHDRHASNSNATQVATSDSRADRPQKIDRPEKNDKVERLEKVERIERPENEHGGTGRH